MYKFVKIKDHRTDLVYNWMLLVTSFEYVLAHDVKYMDSVVTEGLWDYFNIDNTTHYNTQWARNIKTIQDLKGGAVHNVSADLQSRVLDGKMKCLKSFGNVLIRENGSYMTLPSDYTILEEINTKELVYPEYSVDDIRIFTWNGGSHYYAKVGQLDVDIHGECKWNTPYYAQEMALEFFNNLYK